MPQKRVPLEKRLREGTARADRHGSPLLVGGRPTRLDPPRRLDETERRIWRQLAGPSLAAGLLDRVDVVALECAVLAAAEVERADAMLKAEGRFVATPNGYRIAHPAMAIRVQAARDFRAWCGKFGWTPADRAGLAAGGATGRSAEDEFDELAEVRRRRQPHFS